MATLLTRIGTRCTEHPHRSAARLCGRCARPVCAECLSPGDRRPDGTRGWYCRPCAATVREAAAAAAASRTPGARLARLCAGERRLLPGAAALAVLAVLTVAVVQHAPLGAVRQAAGCAFLTRVGSVGALGMPGPQEAVNVLAYPHPAAAVAGVGATRPEFPTAAGGAESETTQALFDECATGWRSAPEVLLPVTLAVRITQDGAFVQRLVFWQDPAAPPAAWAKDFEVLASPDAEGDDFRPVPLDRPAQLLATAEQQWFQVMRLGPPGELGPERLAPEERGRYGQPFPDVLPVKRLVVRVLSTHGAGAGVALGEVGAYGPDLEVTVGPADVMASERTTTAPSAGRFMTCGGAPGLDLMVCPPEIKALTGRPRFVRLLNRSRTEAHTLVTVGQQQNLELRAEPGQAVWGQFVAAAVRGRYDFYCRLPGHDVRGLVGTIVVR